MNQSHLEYELHWGAIERKGGRLWSLSPSNTGADLTKSWYDAFAILAYQAKKQSMS